MILIDTFQEASENFWEAMADPAGVTFGILGLAGAFADAVKCFQYVKLGKNFDDDYKTSMIHRSENIQ